MIEHITDKAAITETVKYLNDAFDLSVLHEAFTDQDTIMDVYKNQMNTARSFLVHFIHKGKQPLVGIFYEWSEPGDKTEYGRNRLMWVSSEMASIISRMQIDNVNALFGKKKDDAILERYK